MQPFAALFVLCAACGAGFRPRDRTIHGDDVVFRVGELPAAWAPEDVGGKQIVFRHAGGARIAAAGRCDRRQDIPLDVATNHLLLGFTGRQVQSQRAMMLDERAALRSLIRASLDGVPRDLDLIVVKKDGCLFDLQLVGEPGSLAAYTEDFAAFWRGFHVVSTP